MPRMSSGCCAISWGVARADVVALLLILLGSGLRVAGAQHLSPVQQAAQSAIAKWPATSTDASAASEGNHGIGVLLDAMDALWYNTADRKYYQYVKESIDHSIAMGGQIAGHGSDTPSIDAGLLGNQLLLLYGVTQDKKYYDAAARLQKQLMSGREPGDGYVGSPFLSEYASTFQQPQDFAEITRRVAAAQPSTGDMPAMAWYMRTLVDMLPYYPTSDLGRAQLLTILSQSAAHVAQDQNRGTGLWGPYVNKSSEKASYLGASCLLTYALARSVRLGYLPEQYATNAKRAWAGIQREFAQTAAMKSRALTGAFVLAGSEMSIEGIARMGAHQKVLLDAWYNSQKRSDAAGQEVYFHYKWDDYSNSGFSLFGHIFRSYGVATNTLFTAPTFAKLQGAQYYIIVSPDNSAKNADPHYMTETDAREIARWVKSGGVLLIMENDPANADIPHMNLLADEFGLHFNNKLTHHVIGDQHEMGRMNVPGGGPLFHRPHTLFMKDTCSLTLGKGAVSLLRDKGDILMGYAKYGEGTVYAVADPWLYNEYTDGRNLPPDYDNFGGGMQLVRWLLQQPELTTH